MKQATMIPAGQQGGGMLKMMAALAVSLAVGAVIVSWPAPAPVAPPLERAAVAHQPRMFADEAAFVLAPADYTGAFLDENYLPYPSAAPRVAPAATVSAARETYASRAFADEAGFVLSAADYASGALGDDYLPLASAVTAPTLSRAFRDELAGAMGASPAIDAYLPAREGLVTVRGPR